MNLKIRKIATPCYDLIIFDISIFIWYKQLLNNNNDKINLRKLVVNLNLYTFSYFNNFSISAPAFNKDLIIVKSGKLLKLKMIVSDN